MNGVSTYVYLKKTVLESESKSVVFIRFPGIETFYSFTSGKVITTSPSLKTDESEQVEALNYAVIKYQRFASSGGTSLYDPPVRTNNLVHGVTGG
jgi:hypothetical protein